MLLWSVLCVLLTFAVLVGVVAMWRDLRAQRVRSERIAERLHHHTFGQVEALLWLYKRLDLPNGLPPTRGWAASPDFLRVVATSALEMSPRIVLECSSGVSTVVLARCAQLLATGHVHSLEHDPVYAQKTRKLLIEHGLQDWATVHDAPLKPLTLPGWTGDWYAPVLPADMRIDLLVIDGPPYSSSFLARYPAVPVLFDRLAPDARVFLDDADRVPERTAVARWLGEYPGLKQDPIAQCEKGAALLIKS